MEAEQKAALSLVSHARLQNCYIWLEKTTTTKILTANCNGIHEIDAKAMLKMDDS